MFLLCAAIGLGASMGLGAEQLVVAPSQGGTQPDFFLRLESKVLKGQPYSAETVSESVQTLGDGNRIVHRTTGRVYRDVEGRTRTEEDQALGTPTISISDPVANLSWTLNPADKTAREMRGNQDFRVRLNGLLRELELTAPGSKVGVITNGTIDGRGAGQGGARGAGGGGRGAATGRGGSVEPPNTVQVAPRAGGGGRGGRGAGSAYERTEEQLPNKSIENLLCTGVRRTTTIPKGAIGNEQPIKIVSEEWTSTDLQVLVLTDLNDPRTGRSTYKLLNVRRADPDLMLFRVPADYTITRGAGGRGRGGN